MKKIMNKLRRVCVWTSEKSGWLTMVDGNTVTRLLRDASGQDLVEYALLLVFLALAAITILPELGKAVNNVFSQSSSALITAGS